MKTELTIKESQHLVELGVSKEKASQRISYGYAGYEAIFTFTDVLELLPKEFVPNKDNEYKVCLDIWITNDRCVVSYDYITHNGCFNYRESKELIDALYELLCWAIENKYI